MNGRTPGKPATPAGKEDGLFEPFAVRRWIARRMEQAYRQALIISKGSNLIFLEKPISLALLICAVLFLCLPTILSKSKQFMAARETSVDAA
jgi:TctA family transporter